MRNSILTVIAVAVLTASSVATSLAAGALYSITGTGNNSTNTLWGSAGQQLLRLSTVSYEDAIDAPSGASRPSARAVSNAVVWQNGTMENDRNLTDMLWQWGQFIDHDMDLTKSAVPAEPFPIPVPAGDPHFDPHNTGVATIGLNRSQYDTATGTGTGVPRQQINTITAFLDASNVYGSDSVRSTALRTLSGGMLKTGPGNTLPLNTGNLPNDGPPSPHNFAAGDIRANEQLGLLSFHTLFVREHNRLAAEIRQNNTALSDEEIYQEARRTVIALLQSITVNEWIPALFGPNALPTYSGYNSSVNPGIANEFSTIAFRFGHSMISPMLMRLDDTGQEISAGHLDVKHSFFRPDRLIPEGGIEPILRGLAQQKMQEVDTREIDALRNFLFGPPGAGGFDLGSLNIQRARDHGLPGYNQLRRDFGLTARTDFDDITSDAAIANALEQVYGGNIELVDAWAGGLAEDHLSGSSVGELFTTIIIDQFTRLRDGDRFWFENEFSGRELTQIKSTKLADVIRRNTDITYLQDDVFFFSVPSSSSSSSSTSSSESSSTSSSQSSSESSSSTSSQSSSSVSSSSISNDEENITLRMSASQSTVEQDDVFTYTITLKNLESHVVHLSSLALALDFDVQFLSATSNATENDNVVRWSMVTLPANAEVTISVTVQVTDDVRDGDRLTSTVVADGGRLQYEVDTDVELKDTYNNNNSTSYTTRNYVAFNDRFFPPSRFNAPVVQRGNITLDVRSDAREVQPGSLQRYTLTLTNGASTPAENIVIEDTFSSQLSTIHDAGGAQRGPDTLAWSLRALQPGETHILHFVMRIHDSVEHGKPIVHTVHVNGTNIPAITQSIETRAIRYLPQTGTIDFAGSVQEGNAYLRLASVESSATNATHVVKGIIAALAVLLGGVCIRKCVSWRYDRTYHLS